MEEIFYVITMQTRNDKTLYLKEGVGKSFEWTFDYDKSIWFETKDDTIKFANEYFKNFKNWNIKEIYYFI